MKPRPSRPAAAAAAPDFATRLLDWFDQYGRHDLPWQHPRSAYRVWLSEIMLQQTQVSTVIPYFQRFLHRFPDVRALAEAPADEVLALWAGLGYYARARNLHRCAQQLMREHGGKFPREIEAMTALPGIGRSTAGAILAQAYGERHAILDGNVKRVLARHAAIAGYPGLPAVQKALWAQAEARLPHTRLADYTQAIMDLGATLCSARAPQCLICPVAQDCQARIAGETARYPGAKPAKARPQRSAQLLLIYDAQSRLLLERRAPRGLWGGLWCPPLLSEGEGSAEDWLAAQDLRVGAAQALPALRHGFTHFELQLQPLRFAAQARGTLLRESRWQWLDAEQLRSLGLPAPIRKMLDSLPQQSLP
ncbi:A/G-specific DNA-adenine glycosylase [Solimonas aquatica]|uniref:Adenine DNA glycosylase n=1 Tax=Solimonas aquatica TaxID=489703 RepID=A0A1H9GJW1_9GAMM|nr:A/G-specific adenine glycosylase [Solimonas aquatica]SEQ50402.1 A/G-specific DNA-adenine glycosylase [Solimonas aquatica]